MPSRPAAAWRGFLRVALGLALGVGILAAHAADTLRIGSKRFTESYILAEVLAQTAAPYLDAPPVVRPGLGNTAIVYEALRSGGIDLYAEYTGTIALEILKSPAPLAPDALREALAPLGLGMAIPLGFNDGYALAVRGAEADALGLRTISDLARHPALRLGLSNEFIGRADGWRPLAQAYGLPQTPTGLDHGLAYGALAAGRVDVIDIYTTDAQIGKLGLRVLADDRRHFPRYDAVVLYRLDVPARFPRAWAALQRLEGRIDERAMIAMNARAELDGAAFDVIARDWLAGAAAGGAAAPGRPGGALATSSAPGTRSGAASGDAPRAAAGTGGGRGFAAKLFGADLGRLTREHLLLVGVSVAAAVLLGVPLAIAAFPHARSRAVLLGLAGLLQTVPALALLAVLIALLGRIGVVPALVALTLYALLPIMRNTVTGLAGVPAGLRQAGTALGMTGAQGLRWVLLPLALPTLLAGVRTATTIAIGTATIAAFIGAGGYGERIVTGLALNDSGLLLAGALPAAVLALLAEALFEGLERLLRRRPR